MAPVVAIKIEQITLWK